MYVQDFRAEFFPAIRNLKKIGLGSRTKPILRPWSTKLAPPLTQLPLVHQFIYPATPWMSWSHSSTLALKFTVLVAQNQKCVVGLAWPKAVSTSWIEESGVPACLSPPNSNYIIPISNQSYYIYGCETWA